MRVLGIIVVIAAALGWWVHDQRAQKATASARPASVAAGFQPYVSPSGAPPRRARVTGVRLITPAAAFQQEVENSSLDVFVQQVEQQSADVLRSAKPGIVRIQFTTGPKYQDVQVQSQGAIDGRLLQELHARMMSLERLRVKSIDVIFELQLTVAP